MKRLAYFISILIAFLFFSCNGSSKSQHSNESQTDKNVKSTVSQSANSSQSLSTDSSIVKLADADLFNFPDLNFAIWFPQEPVREMDTVREAGFLVMFHTIISKTIDKAYMVAVAEYPTDAIKDVPTEQLLKNVMNGFVNSLGMNVQTQSLGTFKGKPGLFYTGQANGDFYYIQNVVDGRRVYQIALLSAKKKATRNELNKYFDSFKFLSD